jgi:predicted Fe-Mo cluster-binding NifX family protein
MRVCIPTTDDAGRAAQLSDHFGRAPYYTIVDTESDEVEVVPNQSRHRGGKKMPPTYVADYDVDAVLLDHVGKRGMELFDEHGIDVLQTSAGTVDEIVERFQNGDLTELTMQDAHSHGGGHGHDHDHEHSHDHDHGHDHSHD